MDPEKDWDLERIGDYAENIVEYATVLADSSQHFSDDAKYEISQLKTMLISRRAWHHLVVERIADHMINTAKSIRSLKAI